MASVSNIISRSGQYEGIVQQLVQLESQKKGTVPNRFKRSE